MCDIVNNVFLPQSNVSLKGSLLLSPVQPHQTHWHWSWTAEPLVPLCHPWCHLETQAQTPCKSTRRTQLTLVKKKKATESLTLMVPSNQCLFSDSLADIQDGSSHISNFHTKSKTLLEKQYNKCSYPPAQRYVSSHLSLARPNSSYIGRGHGISLKYNQSHGHKKEPDDWNITVSINNSIFSF